MDRRRHQHGFTLIELLITLVIIAILAAMALPSYIAYERKARRAEGISTLNSIQLEQEKYRANNTSYGTLANVWGGVTTTTNSYYTLTISNLSSSTYTITATAQGSQANDKQSGTACNVLTLSMNGLTTTQTPAACWSQ